VFLTYIERSIQVRVESITAGAAMEQGLRLAIATVLVTALAASLTRVPWVDEDHTDSPVFRLVGHEGTQLGITPTMQASVLFAVPALDTLAKVSQVLQDNCAARWNSVHDAAGQDMVTVTAEACLPATEDLQATFAALGPFGLALALLPEDASFNFFPVAFSKEGWNGSYGRPVDPKINSYYGVVRLDNRGWYLDTDAEPETPFTINKVSRADLAGLGPCKYFRHVKWNHDANKSRCQICRIGFPIDLEGTLSIERWARYGMRAPHLLSLFSECECGFDCSSCLDTGLNVQVTYQVREPGLKHTVCHVMQANAILFIGIPGNLANSIKCLSELPTGFCQRTYFKRCRRQKQTNGSVHHSNIPYTSTFCK
jgi:hypothetical protein